MIAGVAGGVAEHLDADPSIIRIVWAVLIFLTGGLALLVYIVMAFVVPERPIGMEVVRPPAEPDASEPVPAGSWRAPACPPVPVSPSTAPPPRRQPGPDHSGREGLLRGLGLVRPCACL